MKIFKRLGDTALVLTLSALSLQLSFAAVSAEDSKQLGTTLTKFGADPGKNADGSIPPYAGGLKMSHNPDANQYEDPFANEKPLYSITAKNMKAYEATLTEGVKEALRRDPDWRIDVYPTHRSIAYADWFLDNTVKNATTAKLGGSIEGDTVLGAAPDGAPYQGIPFPIPKNGYEVMWNNYLHFAPPISRHHSIGGLVDTSGVPTELPGIDGGYLHPWSDQSGKLREVAYNVYFGVSAELYSPPSSAGQYYLLYYTPDTAAPQPIYYYSPGTRRVRKAPEFTYDTPNANYGGVIFWDENWGFVGRMDRFDMKLIGKKEMIIPYNVFGATNNKTFNETMGKKHVNPETMRWEKHRVWVVEATRKSGVRHAYSKRTFYIEEDCWCMAAGESYDDTGKIWRTTLILNWPAYDVGGVNNDSWVFEDLQKGNYVTVNIGRKDKGNYVRHSIKAEGLGLKFTPAALSGSGVR